VLLSSSEATMTGRVAGALAAAWAFSYLFFLYAVLRRLMWRADEFQPLYERTALPPREDEKGRIVVFYRLAGLQHGSWGDAIAVRAAEPARTAHYLRVGMDARPLLRLLVDPGAMEYAAPAAAASDGSDGKQAEGGAAAKGAKDASPPRVGLLDVVLRLRSPRGRVVPDIGGSDGGSLGGAPQHNRHDQKSSGGGGGDGGDGASSAVRAFAAGEGGGPAGSDGDGNKERPRLDSAYDRGYGEHSRPIDGGGGGRGGALSDRAEPARRVAALRWRASEDGSAAGSSGGPSTSDAGESREAWGDPFLGAPPMLPPAARGRNAVGDRGGWQGRCRRRCRCAGREGGRRAAHGRAYERAAGHDGAAGAAVRGLQGQPAHRRLLPCGRFHFSGAPGAELFVCFAAPPSPGYFELSLRIPPLYPRPDLIPAPLNPHRSRWRRWSACRPGWARATTRPAR